MGTITRENYASLYGPTTGDRIWLADSELVIEVEQDHTIYGEEVTFLVAARSSVTAWAKASGSRPRRPISSSPMS